MTTTRTVHQWAGEMAGEMIKAMASVTRGFYGSERKRSTWLVGGGPVAWIFIVMIFLFVVSVKLSAYLAIEAAIVLYLGVLGIVYAVTGIVQHRQARKARPGTGPRDWSPKAS